MAKLPKFTLAKNKQEGNWELKEDKTKEIVKVFDKKEDATAGGALKKALGSEGGSVKIKLVNGEFQEERTFPDGADPKASRG